MTKPRVGRGREAAMRPLVEEWRRGQASQAEVARRHGLNAGTFAWWCAQLGGRRGGSEQPGWVAVDVVDPLPQPAGASEGFFEVWLGEMRVRVPAGFGAADLRRLLEVVRAC